MSSLDRIAAPFGSEKVIFRGLSAADQIRLLGYHKQNQDRLAQLGLEGAEAEALAYNAALLYLAADTGIPFESPFSPVLLYSAHEIASLALLYAQWQAGEQEWGWLETPGEEASPCRT